jgi:hypothetical protein
MPIERMSQFPVITALAETDRLVVLTAAGPANATITMANAKVRRDTMYVPAEQMVLTAGTPVIADNLDVATYWSLDSATTETVAGKTLVPDHWVTFDIVVRLLNTTASGGNVRMRADLGTLTTGAIPSVSTGTVTTVAVSATQFLIAEATLRTALAVPADRRVGVSISRVGADGADTLAGDVGLLDVKLARAS